MQFLLRGGRSAHGDDGRCHAVIDPRLLAPPSAFCAPAAQAAGFALKEQSGTGLGSAFAGQAAGGDDISAMFINPAAITRQSGSRISLVTTYIMPRVQFRSGAASTIAAY